MGSGCHGEKMSRESQVEVFSLIEPGKKDLGEFSEFLS